MIPTDKSGTITSGGDSQLLAAANPQRKYFFFFNTSDITLYVNIFGNAATAASPSIAVAPGWVLCYDGTFCPIAALYVYGATTGKTFTASEGGY